MVLLDHNDEEQTGCTTAGSGQNSQLGDSQQGGAGGEHVEQVSVLATVRGKRYSRVVQGGQHEP